MTFVERFKNVLTKINLAHMMGDMQEVEKWKRYQKKLVEREAPEGLKEFLMDSFRIDTDQNHPGIGKFCAGLVPKLK